MRVASESRLALRVVATASLFIIAATCAHAAEPSPPPSPSGEGAEAEPAVSGEALENLHRSGADSTAESAPQTSPSAEEGRATSGDEQRARERARQTPAASPTDSGAASSRGPATRADRLELDTTVVTGNRELPKVLYIVPWKKADIGDLPAQPFNTLLDEVLTPVDRDVFRREVTYYEAVSSGGDASGAASTPSAERTEK